MAKFHIGDVLSITTSRLVSSDGISGVYRILDYMSGENLMTHQLPRVSRECKPVLLEQYPQLGDIDTSGVNNWEVWLAEQANKYGEYLEVTPLLKSQHKHLHPFDEEVLKDKKVLILAEVSE